MPTETFTAVPRCLVPLSLTLAILCAGCQGPDTERINGGGSSFVFPMMIKWARLYWRERGPQVDYSSTGSGNGVRQMLARTIHFGCTDAYISDDMLEKAKADPNGGTVLHLPLLLGAVVPAYNVPGVDQTLNFTGEVLADIYLGKIKNWNDPALQAINPGVKFPDLQILVVSRSDSSGTTAIWVDYLANQISPEMKKKVGTGTSVNFGLGVCERGNERVSGKVTASPGAIGYIELLFALQNNIPYGAVRNQAGRFVRASLASVTAAAETLEAKLPDDLRFSLTNAPGDESYPICGTVWAVFYTEQPNDLRAGLARFFWWATHEGQNHAEQLNYARLPPALVKRIEAKLRGFAPDEPWNQRTKP
jgi:phosphate transport system substrate-binding protein